MKKLLIVSGGVKLPRIDNNIIIIIVDSSHDQIL